MELNLYIVAAKAKGVTRAEIKTNRLVRKLTGVRIFDAGSELHDNYLYIVESMDHLPATLPSFVSIAIREPKNHVWTCNADVLWMDDSLTLPQLFMNLEEVFEYYTDWERRMLRLLAHEAPMKEVGNLALEVLNNPLATYTASLRNIFFCESVRPKQHSVFRDNDAEQYLSDEEINTLKIDPEFIASVTTREPTIFSADIFGYRILYVNLFLSNVYVARLTILEVDRPIRDADFALAQIVAGFITEVIFKQDYSVNNHPRSLDSLLACLLERNQVDNKEIISTLASIGWRINDRFFCCLIGASTYDTVVNTVTSVCATLESRIPCSCAYRYNADILLVVNLTAAKATRTQILSQLIYILREGLLRAGISLEFNDFSELVYFYRQALVAIDIGSRKDETIWCYRYENYTLMHLLERAKGTDIIKSLCPPGLLKLMEYDKSNNRDYVKKLNVYLKCNMCIADAIRQLFVQRATFIYQLKRITEISDLDLDDSNLRLHLQICLKMLEDAGQI